MGSPLKRSGLQNPDRSNEHRGVGLFPRERPERDLVPCPPHRVGPRFGLEGADRESLRHAARVGKGVTHDRSSQAAECGEDYDAALTSGREPSDMRAEPLRGRCGPAGVATLVKRDQVDSNDERNQDADLYCDRLVERAQPQLVWRCSSLVEVLDRAVPDPIAR